MIISSWERTGDLVLLLPETLSLHAASPFPTLLVGYHSEPDKMINHKERFFQKWVMDKTAEANNTYCQQDLEILYMHFEK